MTKLGRLARVDETYVRAALEFQNIPVPDEEIGNVRMRLLILMRAYDEIETILGSKMDTQDPIPPVLDDGGRDEPAVLEVEDTP